MATTKRNQKSVHKVETVCQNEGTKQAAGEVLKVDTSQYDYLLDTRLELLSTLSGEFVDIHHLSVAKELRIIERQQAVCGHKLIEIGKVVGGYIVHEPHPYFSVKLGDDGLKLKVGV
ncbi:hypothetical protein KASIA_p028 [Shewanella phage vB_SspS_KASIA]|nr:hypothetical protein KASIA_p028 [Shewanella phage vB_SspS_KASIA]